MLEPSWRSVAELAHRYGAKYPDLVAAQWALESGYGKYPSGRHNYFGLKGPGTSLKTREVYGGKEEYIYDSFIDFNSLEECVEYLVDRWYLDYKDYKGVNNASNREDAARQLQSQGYATDPHYATALIDLMRKEVSFQKQTSVKPLKTSRIKLADAAKYYAEEPHQIKAWGILQESLTPEQLKIFEEVYRGGSADAIAAKAAFPLGVPYYYQRNSNTGHGERMCQSSCIAMTLEYLFPNVIDGDDDVWLLEVFKYGDTVSQKAQLDALWANGVDGVKFSMMGCEDDLLNILDKGCPVPIGILHKGLLNSPTGGGHWITLIGYDDENFHVHDPFGELDLYAGRYIKTGPNDGNHQKYSRKNLMKRWLIASNSDGWYYDFSKAKLS